MAKKTPTKERQRAEQALKPATRRAKLQTRANTAQMQILVTNASVYFKGNMSELLLQAALAYRPVRKDQGRKSWKARIENLPKKFGARYSTTF